jgi:GT2 family glycosyltransferase
MPQPALASPDITVIITTRNRAAYLPDVLARLMAQETQDPFTREVLIVDNGSTDDTRRVVQEQQRALPLSIRYTYEARVGRPYALNRGLAEAAAPILAFTDDDTLPTPTWLHALWACLREERADAVTGKVLPHWMAPRPPWLTDEGLRAIGRLGCLDHGPHRRRTSARQDCRWFTSNLALRRESVRSLGGWDERLPYYQDTEYYHRAVRAGLNIVYEPAAVVYHKIGPERLTLGYFRQRRRLGAAYRARQMGWRQEHLLTLVPLAWYGRVWRSALGWASCALRGAPWWQRFQHELSLREAVGTWCYRLRRWPRWCLSALTGRPFAP